MIYLKINGKYPFTVGSGIGYHGSIEPHYSVRGNLFHVWKRKMPPISELILECVIYLYPSTEDAENGERYGGSGFLVGVESKEEKGISHLYAVSNSHVVHSKYDTDADSPIIRFNTQDGKTDVCPLDGNEWIPSPDGTDLAIAYLGWVDPAIFKYSMIHKDILLTPELMQSLPLRPGHDTFMVGRMLQHEGKQRNTPAVRFGNISMLPYEPIPHPSRPDQLSFLVETRSLTGFSGSPVFVHFPVGQNAIVSTRPPGPYLLGIDWGQLPLREDVYQIVGESDLRTDYITLANSGQMAVIPAWKLSEMLFSTEFDNMRKEMDAERKRQKAKSPVILDASKKPKELPFSRGDFIEALKKTSQKTSLPEPKNSETSE